jgi:type VI secretion system protein ImpJ
MNGPQRVVWSEGLFITPQHFQQQDLYHERLLALRLGALSPHAWGVIAQDIDREALVAGQLQLRVFAGILADGTPISFERGQAEAPPARPVEEHFPASARMVEVYLGLPRERAGVQSYGSGQDASVASRYQVASRPIEDLHAAGSLVPVDFAQRNTKILFGTEPRDDFEAIKIAEVMRDATGAYALVEAYSPPALRLEAAPAIAEGVRKLLRTMGAKQRELSDARRHRDAASLEFTASDVTRFLQLNALNGTLPVLNHLVDTGDLHPYAAYLILIQAAGQLSTFSAEADAPVVPKFQFMDLRATFDPLLQLITSHLKAVALEQCISVPLEKRQGGLHIGKLTDERAARCPQFILTVKSDLPEKTVAEQLPKLSKIASQAEIQGLVQAAAPGVPIQVTFRPPPEVPVRPGVVYFSLGTEDSRWQNAVRDRTVAIYLPQPFDPQRTQIELLAVPSAAR